MPDAKPHTTCRACGSTDLKLILDLGEQPLANNLTETPNADVAKYPLRLLRCERCTLGQLDTVVNPDLMFRDYAYRSGVSAGWREHCAALASRFQAVGRWWLDIGCNDGTMLDAAKAAAFQTVGVDPMAHTSPIHHVVKDYWNFSTALVVLRHLGQKPMVVTAQNVFAHLDKASEFLAALELVLHHSHGYAFIESPDGDELVTRGLYDTVYHEHLSYWTPRAVDCALRQHGLSLAREDFMGLHGGTRRYEIAHRIDGESLERPAKVEADTLQERSDAHRDAYLAILASHWGRLFGYGAAAKTTVLMNYAGPAGEVPYVLEDNPAKVGKFIPGTGAEVVDANGSFAWQPDDLMVIYPWNWEAEIVERLRGRGYIGKILSLRPTPRIL